LDLYWLLQGINLKSSRCWRDNSRRGEERHEFLSFNAVWDLKFRKVPSYQATSREQSNILHCCLSEEFHCPASLDVMSCILGHQGKVRKELFGKV
jgi:hypothetical protein